MTGATPRSAGGSRKLLWDIDGTLVRFAGVSEDKHAAAVESVLCRSVDRDLRTAGMTDLEIVLAIFDAQGVVPTPDEVDAALDVLNELTEREMSSDYVIPLDGAGETLAAAEEMGWTNGLLTGNTPERARTKLTSAGLWTAVAGGGGFFGDRHGDRFSLAAEGAATRTADLDTRIVIVGDTPLDIQAGRDAGLLVVAVATGKFDAGNLIEYEPDLLITDLVAGRRALLAFLMDLG